MVENSIHNVVNISVLVRHFPRGSNGCPEFWIIEQSHRTEDGFTLETKTFVRENPKALIELCGGVEVSKVLFETTPVTVE